MRNMAGHKMLLTAAAVCAAVSLSGCGQRVVNQTEAQTERRKATEAMTEAPVQVTEAQTQPPQTETQKLITSVDYTSKDGSIKITLPDNTWKVIQDADEMRIFQSGNDAIINIVHADNPASMKSQTVMTSKEDLEASLTKQYQDEDAYEIEDFIGATMDNIKVFRYTVKYNAAARMWAYAVTNAVIDGDSEAYVVTGTVTDDNKTLLEAVRKAVESFRVLNDETLRKVTGEVITGTPQITSEEVKTGTVSAEEMESLVDYGTGAELVTNDAVNVRLSPGTDSGVLTTLSKGDKVTVTGETSNWFKVVINGNTGYIRKDFLIYPQDAASDNTNTGAEGSEAEGEQNAEAAQGGQGVFYASSDGVNVRNAPGTDSDVIGLLGNGQAVTVTGESDGWYIVSVDGMTGYVAKSLLTAQSQDQQPSGSENTGADPAAGGDIQLADDGQQPADGNQNAGADAGMTSIGGTIISSSVDTITIQADDGSVRTIYYGDAGLNTNGGLYDGVYVEVQLDPQKTDADGNLHALDVTGY